MDPSSERGSADRAKPRGYEHAEATPHNWSAGLDRGAGRPKLGRAGSAGGPGMPEAEIDAGGRGIRRDGLGHACFYLHFAVMIFIVLAWAIPSRGMLLFYLVFLPAVALQWRFNRNTCVLNNIESLIRTGRWRNASNPEEGAWFLTLARHALGVQLRSAHMDAFLYAALLVLWGLALGHLLRF